VASIAVVVPTKLAGFSAATFTAGVQQAYRLAIATEAGNISVDKVIISNVRDARRSRLLGEHPGNRDLNVVLAAVDFDTSFSVADAAAATAMTATVAAVTPAAIKPQLVAQLKVVQASGDFADVASVDVDAIALAINVAQQAAAIFTQAVTGTPTPAPPPPANPFECVPDGWWSGKIGGAMMAGVVVAFWGWGKHVGRKKNSARLTMAEVHKVATFTSSETAILALAMVDFISDCLFIADRFRCRHNGVALDGRYADLALLATASSVGLGLLIVFGILCVHSGSFAEDGDTNGFTDGRTNGFNKALLFLCATHLDLLKLLPWDSTARDNGYEGLPTKALFLLHFVTLLENSAQVSIQYMFIADGGSWDGWMTLAAIISSGASVLYGVYSRLIRSCFGAAPNRGSMGSGRTPAATATGRTVAAQAAQQGIV